MRVLKLQSAMEYLMTYGWAILIIAVVLGALFGLGFFNSANLAPKVSAGACQVYRPQGPGTTSFINLEGTCNNELPQYVGYSASDSQYVLIPYSRAITPGIMTFSFWLYANSARSSYERFASSWLPSSCWTVYTNSATDPNIWFQAPSFNFDAPYTYYFNRWALVTLVDSGTVAYIYIDGMPVASASASALSTSCTNDIYLFTDGTASNEMISNVQMYNASLSANEITALYDEGIGGVPMSLNSLVGWWPLNGNANDYSGNMNNGAPTGVVYTSSWTAGYSAP